MFRLLWGLKRRILTDFAQHVGKIYEKEVKNFVNVPFFDFR